MPLSGGHPLSVNFNAASSVDPNPCTTITTYTLDFGDGTPPVSQSTPNFPHLYNNPGDYPARLTVKDSANQVSNAVQVVIHVGSGQVQAAGVVSQKVHGAAGPIDLVLPTSGPPAIECRKAGDTPDPNVDYKLIFVFPNQIQSVGSISASSTGFAQPDAPTGSIGSDPRQYIVKLTHVPNKQYLTVTLNNVIDSQNLAGNVSATLGILVGDVDGSGHVDVGDIAQVQRQNSKSATASFRADVDASGHIDAGDIARVQQHNSEGLPPR
jgi:hypothetical protein